MSMSVFMNYEERCMVNLCETEVKFTRYIRSIGFRISGDVIRNLRLLF